MLPEESRSEAVAPKAGPGTGLVIAILAAIVVLLLIFFYWMGAWRDTGGALDPMDERPPREVQQQPAQPPP